MNLIWLPISVRFGRWHRFRTVCHLSHRVPDGHTAVLCSGRMLCVLCVLCVLCTVYSVSSVLCVCCVLCVLCVLCVMCVLCRLCVTNPCVSVIESGYFGNLFGNSTNDPPFCWLFRTAKCLTFLVYPCYNTVYIQS